MRLHLLLLTFAFLLSVSSAQAIIYNLSHECQNECIADTAITWNVTLDPGSGTTIDLLRVEVVESRSRQVFALYNESEVVYEPTTFALAGRLPAFAGVTHVNVSVCITTRTAPKDRVVSSTFLGNSQVYCPNQNFTMPLYQCTSGAMCAETESCTANTCQPLLCGSCQYIADNRCVFYQCCSDAQCGQSAFCSENICASLACRDDQVAKNHTCVPLACADNEVAKNHECVALECAEDEIALEQQCTKLECPSDQHAVNHECVALECAENQVPIANRCVTTQVRPPQETVITLPSQYNPAYALLELSLLVLIGALLYLDVHTHAFRLIAKSIRRSGGAGKK